MHQFKTVFICSICMFFGFEAVLLAEPTGVFPAYRVERGETCYIYGSHVFSNMVVNGTLILTGDTVITLVGPPIEDDDDVFYPDLVFFMKYSGKIVNEPVNGFQGLHGSKDPRNYGPSGLIGRDANPDNPDDIPGNGTNGFRGYDGTDGTSGGDGRPAPTLIIQAKGGGAYLSGLITLTGGNGGAGGVGGDACGGGGGGWGGYSKYLPDGHGGDGGIGGNGGNGGSGGNGGEGGTFKLVSAGNVYLLNDINVTGGNGSGGRSSGDGGTGGRGGDGGNPTLWGVTMDGTPGDGNTAGHTGVPGNGGHGGDGGRIDIVAKGDILTYSTPRIISMGGAGGSRGGNGGGGGHGGAGGRTDTSEGAWGVGHNRPDYGGHVGNAGRGGKIRVTTYGSLKTWQDDPVDRLAIHSHGNKGGRPMPMDEPSKSQGVWFAPLDGFVQGGNGSDAGKIEIKARGSVEVIVNAQGGAGNYGQDGLKNVNDEVSNGARGGDGGDGGSVEVTAPFLNIDPATDIMLTGGSPGTGGYPGGYPGTDPPYGEWGPSGNPGREGKYELIEADPVMFPQTSAIIVTSLPEDKAPVGKIVHYQYTFLNDDPELTIEDIKLTVNWPSPYCEPVECDLNGVPNGHGFAAFPPDLPAGETLTWNFSVRIIKPFRPNVWISCDVKIMGEVADSPGDDYALLTLPMAPQEGLWFEIVPSSSCVRPGGELQYTVQWGNTNSEDAFSGVSIELGSLPQGVSLVSGDTVWNVGTLGPGDTGWQTFSVKTTSPWDDAWGEHFSLDGTAEASELDGALALEGVRDVWVEAIALTVEQPAAEYQYRGNRVGSSGFVSDCTSGLEPGDVGVSFTTSGVDADTGAAKFRQNDPVPMSGLSFDTVDAARLIAIQNTVMGYADAVGGESAEDGPFTAVSVFYRVVHDIFEGSLPRLGRWGLPSSGQRTELINWKADYPEVSEEAAGLQTDAVERLDSINYLGVIAQMIAASHYPEVAEGLEGIFSVWDAMALFTMGVSRNIMIRNRLLGVFGTKTMRLGAITGEASDFATNTLTPGILKKLGINKFASDFLQNQAMQSYMAQYSDDIVHQIAITTQWQLGSGKLLQLLVRNMNSSTEHQNWGMKYWIADVYPIDIPVDPAIHGAIDGLLKMIVEPFFHGAIANGQRLVLELNFSGSQDLALLAGENARQVLSTMSGIALRWGDLNDSVHDISVAARDSFMWMQLIPYPPIQDAVGKAYYVADATGRMGALMKTAHHANMLLQVAEVTASGVQSIVKGNLDSFGYPISDDGWFDLLSVDPWPKLLKKTSFRPTAGDQTATEVLALYDQVEIALESGDADTLADLGEALAPLHEELIAAETLLSNQAEVLVGAPPSAVDDPPALTAVARDYQYAALDAGMDRKLLMQMMYARALGPNDEVKTNALDALASTRQSLSDATAKGATVASVLSQFVLPDAPSLVGIKAPMAAQTGTTVTIALTLANYGEGQSAGGWVTLLTPPGLTEDLISTPTQHFTIGDGPTRVEWELVPTHPGMYVENFMIHLYDNSGWMMDMHNLMLTIDEAGDSVSLVSGQGGALESDLGTASLDIPSGSFPNGVNKIGMQLADTVDVHLIPVVQVPDAIGSLRVGETAYLVSAFDHDTASTVALSGSLPTLTLHWQDAHLPPLSDPAQLHVMMAETETHWAALDSVVDTNTRTITATIPRAGWFAIGYLDDQPPAAPQGLKAEVLGGRVRLSWQSVDDSDLAGYGVIAGPQSGQAPTQLYKLPTDAYQGFDVPDHPQGTTQYYSVLAFDGAGNISEECEPVRIGLPWSSGLALAIRPVADKILTGGVALFDLDVFNNTSAALDLQPVVVTLPKRCEARFDPGTLTVSAGGRRTVRLAIGAAQYAPRGINPFTIRVSGGGAQQTIGGSLEILPDGESNLAASASGGRIAEYSSADFSGGLMPDLVIDEVSETFWQTERGHVASEWLKITLPGEDRYWINRIVLRLAPDITGSLAGAASDVEVWVSDTTLEDDAFTTQVLEGKLAASSLAQEFPIGPEPVRYLWIKCLTTQGESDAIALAEVEVYGEPETAAGDWGALLDHLLGRRQLDLTEQNLCDFNNDDRIDVADLVWLLSQTIEAIYGL